MSSADVTASTPTRQDYSWCNLPCDGRPASYHPHGPVPYHDMYVPPPEPALVDAPPWLAQPQYFTQPLPPHVDRQATVEELQQLRQELTLTTQTIRQEISELHQTALAARELSELSTSAQATTRNDLSAIRNDLSAITAQLALACATNELRKEISELSTAAQATARNDLSAIREFSELSTAAQATTRNDLSAIRNDISAITTALAPNRKSHCS